MLFLIILPEHPSTLLPCRRLQVGFCQQLLGNVSGHDLHNSVLCWRLSQLFTGLGAPEPGSTLLENYMPHASHCCVLLMLGSIIVTAIANLREETSPC